MILKTNSSINEKLKSVIFKLNIVLAVLTILSLSVWQFINPTALNNFKEQPYLVVFPLLFFGGIVGLFFIKKIKKDTHAFVLSTLLDLSCFKSWNYPVK